MTKEKKEKQEHSADCARPKKGVCNCSGKPLSRDATKALQRPENFFELSGETQWAIDKGLGILDWDGT